MGITFYLVLSQDFETFWFSRNTTSLTKKKLYKKHDYGSSNQQTDQKIDKLTDILAMH